MKKLIIAAVLSSVLLVNAAFANKIETVNFKVENAFRKEFVQAKDVSWEKTDKYYKATFKMNNQLVDAYFTPDGEMIGVIHNMLSTQLPVSLQVALKKDYSNCWISELFEFSREDSNGYFVTVQNADQIITLQSTDGFSWSAYSKTKK